MVGVRLIIIMAIVGGLIAYIADKMGTKIGKKKMSVFGLRPKYTSILLTVTGGVLISITTILVVSLSSNSARTALWGMEQLQQELRALNKDKEAAKEQLAAAQDLVKLRNKHIDALDVKIAEMVMKKEEAEEQLEEANSELEELHTEKDKLSQDVKELSNFAEELRQDLTIMREGQVYYRAGELVYSGVMRTGLTHDQNVAQINWLLQNANISALERLGLQRKEKEMPQAIWISRNVVNNAVNMLDNSKVDLLIRVRTVANIIVGELAMCDLEISPNKLIYPKKSLVYEQEYRLGPDTPPVENLIMEFLTIINHRAVEAGVLPDPLTGKVGNMDAATMLGASNDIRNTKGHFILSAYAQNDITTAGPVRLTLHVKQVASK